MEQGCILSPLILNIYSEHIFKEALDDVTKEILLSEEGINNIRYADDTVILAVELGRATESSKRYGLNININKTKTMNISKDININNLNHHLMINQRVVERVSKYSYLVTIVINQ